MRFHVLEEFEWAPDGVVIAHYVPGLGYNLRPGNDRLKEALEGWVEEGKAKMGPPPGEKTSFIAQLSAQAQVKKG